MSAEEKASSSLTDSKGSNVTAKAEQPIHIRFATNKLSHVANIPKRGSNSLTVTLLISFAIPVYLEILDYTGKGTPVSQTWILIVLNYLSVVAPSEYRIAVRTPDTLDGKANIDTFPQSAFNGLESAR